MAKPIESEAGSAMHIHQSIVTAKTGRNVFADGRGRDTELFHAHIAGLQHYLAAAMPLLAPNVNSYRRLRADSDAPINTHWDYENRTVGLRVPESDPAPGAGSRTVSPASTSIPTSPSPACSPAAIWA